jgi:hypothetical protein
VLLAHYLKVHPKNEDCDGRTSGYSISSLQFMPKSEAGAPVPLIKYSDGIVVAKAPCYKPDGRRFEDL